MKSINVIFMLLLGLSRMAGAEEVKQKRNWFQKMQDKAGQIIGNTVDKKLVDPAYRQVSGDTTSPNYQEGLRKSMNSVYQTGKDSGSPSFKPIQSSTNIKSTVKPEVQEHVEPVSEPQNAPSGENAGNGGRVLFNGPYIKGVGWREAEDYCYQHDGRLPERQELEEIYHKCGNGNKSLYCNGLFMYSDGISNAGTGVMNFSNGEVMGVVRPAVYSNGEGGWKYNLEDVQVQCVVAGSVSDSETTAHSTDISQKGRLYLWDGSTISFEQLSTRQLSTKEELSKQHEIPADHASQVVGIYKGSRIEIPLNMLKEIQLLKKDWEYANYSIGGCGMFNFNPSPCQNFNHSGNMMIIKSDGRQFELTDATLGDRGLFYIFRDEINEKFSWGVIETRKVARIVF